MTQQFRAIPAEGAVGAQATAMTEEPTSVDSPALWTMPDRPFATPRPVTDGPTVNDVQRTPIPDELATQRFGDDPTAVTMAAAAIPSVPGYNGHRAGGLGHSGGVAVTAGPTDGRPKTGKSTGLSRSIQGAAIAAMGVVVIGAGVAALYGKGSPKPASAAKSSSSAPARTQRGAPSPGGSPGAAAKPAGPALTNGRMVSYATTTREQGYFEGVLTLTNRTNAPITNWQMSFNYPGATIKSVWGGVLVQGGGSAIIKGAPGSGPIPVGGAVQVRIGAAGKPSAPYGCTLNGAPC
ncbi:MAG TPA: cellulose binding domain-containing protein [Streptosporangiaceae bacterium]|jgi:hypothetical protein